MSQEQQPNFEELVHAALTAVIDVYTVMLRNAERKSEMLAKQNEKLIASIGDMITKQKSLEQEVASFRAREQQAREQYEATMKATDLQVAELKRQLKIAEHERA